MFQRLTHAIVSALCFLTALSACYAQTRANSLTPQQVQAGWILLFDGETTFGWAGRGSSDWKVSDGMITSKSGGPGMLATTTEFADFELQADVWVDNKVNSGIMIRGPIKGDITPLTSYEVNVYDAHKEWPSGSINFVGRTKSKVKTVGRWSTYDIHAEGGHLIVKVNGKTTVDAMDSKFARGIIALQYNGEGEVKFKNVRLRPLSTKPLFNGKDLTGWYVVPGHKSIFTVSPEGWLIIKNGNGDIQTEAEFGDFILQSEILSNGDHLNSGIFFRANKGLFWSGYEAQIRNQWQGDDRTKAVDYGTGGVYNRQPARKVVSSDREWFTMTVVAHGYHIAIWVNGIQVSDFQDERPVDETNARKGARKTPGVFSLQGHDPTTDLSFRQIRAVEYPSVKQQ